MTLTEAEVRNINLIEILLEDAEESGSPVQEPPEEAKSWLESEIRAYFASGGAEVPAPLPSPPPPVMAHIAEPDPEEFARWFPGLKLSGTCRPDARVRILCFPNAGNAEDLFTSEGTGVRRSESPLLGAEVLSVQYPGRAARRTEAFVPSAAAMAAALAPVAASRLAGARAWVAIGHSAGAWVAYETLQALAALGVPAPAAVYLSAMSAPSWPERRRPWRRQRDLDEAAFVEECRGWDVSPLLFTPALWPVYQPIMRADFRLFDEYVWRGGDGGDKTGREVGDGGGKSAEVGGRAEDAARGLAGVAESLEHRGDLGAAASRIDDGPAEIPASAKIRAPVLAFWGSEDRRISREMVEAWATVVEGRFEAREIRGTHLWPLEKGPKALWLHAIVEDVAANADVLRALGGAGGVAEGA